MDNLHANETSSTTDSNHQQIGSAASSHLQSTKTLLAVQHKNLNPSYEMKRMFGSKVVQTKQ